MMREEVIKGRKILKGKIPPWEFRSRRNRKICWEVRAILLQPKSLEGGYGRARSQPLSWVSWGNAP